MTEPFVYRREMTIALARCVALVVGFLLLYALLPFQSDDWWVAAVVGVVAIAAIIPVTLRRVRRLRASDRPVADAVEAMTALLTMLVVGFSSVYLTLDRRVGQMSGLETRIDSVYFTLTTISTVGFGDIHASGQAAWVIVSIQIIMNFLLVAVVIRVFGAIARDRVKSSGREIPGGERPGL